MNIANVFAAIAGLGWVAAIGVLAIILVRTSRNQPVRRLGTVALILFLVAVALTTVSSGVVFINPQERGVVISAVSPSGYRSDALQPGLRWVIPFAESVVRYPVSKQTYTMSISTSEGDVQGDDSIAARTADGQEIFVDASVIYAIDPNQAVSIHIAWQNRYSEDFVRPQTRGVIRDAVSQFGVEEVVSSKRFEMVDEVRRNLEQKFSENGLVLVDFVLRNITFSPEYAASVEQKQIAEQQAQQARFVVEQRKQEAEQARQVAEGKADAQVIEAKGAAEARVIEAQAEAQSLELIAAALQDNPNLLTYQYISKLTPSIQTLLLPSDSPFLFPLPQGVTQQPQTPAGPETNP
ncbi:MAG: hypothetical protein GYA17_14530 [Chloroflexi bacterium]|jgi:regulator of protease activity HflC (stomatin/prohibitin superfamily)|nr:hypothetical protein [Chloroflexota bacterium]